MSTQKSSLVSVEEDVHPASGQRRALRQHSQAPAESTSADASGFSGTCENASLVDWIQLVQMGRRDAVIGVRTHDGRKGLLWCRDGDVIDAWCEGVDASSEGVTGEEAVYRALNWEGGRISVAFATFEHPRRIQVGTTALLLRAACRRDSGVREIQAPPRMTASVQPPPAAPEAKAHAEPPANPRKRRRRVATLSALALSLLAAVGLGVTLLGQRTEVVQGNTQKAALPIRTEVEAARTLPVPPPAPTQVPSTADDVASVTAASQARATSALRTERTVPAQRRAASTAPTKPTDSSLSEPTATRRALPRPEKKNPELEMIDERTPRVRIIDERASQIEVIE